VETAINVKFIRGAKWTALLAIILPCAVVLAQSQLPSPSRTIYKCVVKGAVSYSDEPCEGGQRLDATPASGVTHLSGSSRTGKDVANEKRAEQFADAIRPLTGMTAPQFATASRRNHLATSVQQECGRLEPAILALEGEEKRTGAGNMKQIQQDLFTLRKRYKTLGC